MGSKLSNNDISNSNISAANFSSPEIDLSWTEAMIIPISASLSLLLLFFFFHYLQYFLLLIVLIGSTTSLFQICQHIGKYLLLVVVRSHNLSNVSNVLWIVNAFSIIFTIAVTCEWIRSGNFVCHDILGCSLCIAFISTVVKLHVIPIILSLSVSTILHNTIQLRFPSLKLATFCLTGLVIYDIYWVFLSEFFFRSNVMVAGTLVSCVEFPYCNIRTAFLPL